MTNFMLAYTGGSMAQTEAEQAAVMASWGAWFASLGPAIVDAGAPFGPAARVSPDGSIADGAPCALTGYTIVTADSLASATTLAKDCPVLSSGGAVEVYEALPM